MDIYTSCAKQSLYIKTIGQIIDKRIPEMGRSVVCNLTLDYFAIDSKMRQAKKRKYSKYQYL